MKIPYRFTLFGNVWHISWKDPSPRLPAKRGKKLIGLTYADSRTRTREIVLHPKLRRDPLQRWQTFAHELLHALQMEMRIHQQTRGWWKDPITHGQIEMLEIPLGAFLSENLSPCCAHCSRKQKSVSQR